MLSTWMGQQFCHVVKTFIPAQTVEFRPKRLEHIMVTSNFSFFHNVFKGFFLRVVKTQSCMVTYSVSHKPFSTQCGLLKIPKEGHFSKL